MFVFNIQTFFNFQFRMFECLLYPGAQADQRSHQDGYLVIPQCAGWITSYPPVVIGYIMQICQI